MSYGGVTLDREELVAFSSEFDPQPFHLDEEAARSTFAGRLIASGWQTCGLQMRMMAEGFILEASSMGAPGIEEVSWLAPVQPGDTLRVRHEVLEARRSSRRPEMGLVRFRFETINQHGEVVLRTSNWIMLGVRDAWRDDAPAGKPPPPRPAPPAAIESPPAPTPWFEDVVVGSTTDLGSYAFTEQNIVDFARRYDPQPFHLDREAAARTHFGGLCASGWHTAAAWMKQL
ncbi:MAG: dehydratase, partial [Salinarimonadaceae bacterium]